MTTLLTSAGNNFTDVSIKAKNIAKEKDTTVEFEFNGVTCLVNKNTNLDWPLTDKVLEDAIIKVLEVNDCPLSEKEIEKGIKQLKTIGNVIPETDNLIEEYKRIKQKNSVLSKITT